MLSPSQSVLLRMGEGRGGVDYTHASQMAHPPPARSR